MKRFLMLLISLVAVVGCSESNVEIPKPNTEGGGGSTTPTYISDDPEANTKMDHYLKTYYLYNKEYKGLDLDFDLLYSDFLTTALKSMSTNVLDHKNGKLYSYVTRNAKSRSLTRASAAKELTMSYGVASAVLVSLSDFKGGMELGVSAVYPESPASEAGVRRGDFITHVNGVELTINNIYGYAQLLLQPTSSSKLTLTMSGGEKRIITSRAIYPNPVLKYEVYGDVGYLNYHSFDSAYDEELMSALSYLSGRGVKDLILDLRLNGGGHVASSRILASSIGGASCHGKVFTRYSYNDDIMALNSPSYSEKEMFLSSGVPQLSLTRLYCLVSENTASASELIINSLRGIDCPVTLIGARTNGKNVGMLEFNFSTDKWTYDFLPICFQCSNAKGDGDYEDGFAVNYAADDWGGGDNFKDFSSSEVMIAKALSLISGTRSVSNDVNDCVATSSRVIVGQVGDGNQLSGTIVLNPER